MREKETNEERGFTMEQIDSGDKCEGVRIELHNVWFRYPTRDVPVLCGLDMTVSGPLDRHMGCTDIMKIEKGQFAAIVGPSGIHAVYA